MQDNFEQILGDLALAGVKFEIDESPTIQKVATAQPAVAALAAGRAGEYNPAAPLARVAINTIPKSEPVAVNAIVQAAGAAAGAARSMDELLVAIAAFDKQPTLKLAKNIILPRVAAGGAGAKILAVVDAPDKEDDVNGAILSGASGELFGKMLRAIDIEPGAVSVFPVMFHKLPGDRSPSAEELKAMRPFYDKFLEFLRPEFILTFGAAAFGFASGLTATLPRSHGKEFDVGGAKLVPTFGVRFIMAKPEFKKDAWADLQSFKKSVECGV